VVAAVARKSAASKYRRKWRQPVAWHLAKMSIEESNMSNGDIESENIEEA
jgi:hypothetical protein